ncbi:MAG: beta-galactosidase, partial [Candidatus Omnitrophica bacterium]|nr:beta-galactosidase [Candidatus Omnitrophota bacterium]
MKKIFCFLLLFPFLAAGKHQGDYLHSVTTKYLTPHLDWAKPLAAGKIKCLFVVCRQGAREVVELWQRLDLDFQAVTVFHSGLLAMEDMYEGQVEGTTGYEKKNELLTKLNGDYNVFVFGNVRFDILPAEAKYRILEKVKKGVGLVFFYDQGTAYQKLFAFPEKTDWIEKGVALRSLPFSPTSWTPAKVLTQDKKFKTDQLLRGYKFGEGRILVVDYPGRHSTYYSGLGLTNPESYSAFWKSTYENYLVLVARAILWAGKRESSSSLLPANFQDGQIIPQENLPLPLGFKLTGETSEKKVYFRLRDERNQVVYQKVIGLKGEVSLPIPLVKAGRYFLDYIISSKKGVEDFGFFQLEVEGKLREAQLLTDKNSYKPGERIKGQVSFGGSLKGNAELLVELRDCLKGKIYLREKYSLAKNVNQLSFELPGEGFPTLSGYLTCQILEDNQLVLKLEKEVFFPKREREIFPNILWGGINVFLSEMFLPQVLKAGFTASLDHPTEEGKNAKIGALFNLRMVPYMYRIMLGNDEKGWTQEQWLKTADPKNKEKYNGDGSFYNPLVQQAVREVIEKRITNLPLYGPLVYNLGDENFFSYEAGYSPSDEKAFREFLRSKYQSISSLNQEWGENFGSFDEVKHYSLKEAATTKKYAAWFDHRCFMEKQYADYHHHLAKVIKEIDPQAEVGAEGSVPGNLEETISQLELWGPYEDKIGNELLRSIGWDRLRTNWWGGYVGSHGGRDGYPYPLWKPLLCGVVNGNAWFASGPFTEGFIAVDFSYAEYFEEMLPRLQKLNDGLAALLALNRIRNDGIAIHWSHASSSISLLGEPFFSPKNSIAQFIDFCYRHGFGFNFLTTKMVESGQLSGYKILFLFGSSAITEAERKEIEKFVKGGGVVVADMNPGILNGFCRPLGTSQLNELFGTALKGQEKFVFKSININAEVKREKIFFQAEKVQSSPEAEVFVWKQTEKGLA